MYFYLDRVTVVEVGTLRPSCTFETTVVKWTKQKCRWAFRKDWTNSVWISLISHENVRRTSQGLTNLDNSLQICTWEYEIRTSSLVLDCSYKSDSRHTYILWRSTQSEKLEDFFSKPFFSNLGTVLCCSHSFPVVQQIVKCVQ